MSDAAFLHGVEVVEIDDGIRPIETVRTSVIGLVGTAEDSEDAVVATLAIGSAAADNGLLFSAAAPGVGGNNVGLYLKAVAANQTLGVSEANSVITVTLATDSSGAITSTAAAVTAAIEANLDAARQVSVADIGTSDGTGLCPRTTGITYLSGGQDEAFPLNTPVLVIGSRRQSARLGALGTLPKAMDAIFDQAPAWVVIVRVAEGVDDAATQTNLIGNSATGTGMHALVAAESATGVKPRILIAPEWTDEPAVAAEMLGVADQLKAVVIIDGPNTTSEAAVDYRANFGSDRAYIIDPQVKVWDSASNSPAYEPASARVAGIINKSDNERGFWWSPSNRLMNGITGTKRPVGFGLNDPLSEANYLNENEVATIIRKDGFRLWGNRSCSADPKWAFLSVRRTADMIHEALIRAHFWAVDRNITKVFIEEVMFAVQSYINHLQAKGAVLGGSVWIDAELNTPESIASGRIYFDFDFTPPYPAERITFRSHLVTDYIRNIIPDTQRSAAPGPGA